MARADARKSLKVARQHLQRVQSSWDDPTDWVSLTIFGFYCLEAAVSAAAAHAGMNLEKSHPKKAEAAKALAAKYGVPNVSDLLATLNRARKATAYGDIELPELDPEELAAEIESYVDAVESFLTKEGQRKGR